MQRRRIAGRKPSVGTVSLLALLLAACTARLPADVELVSVEAVARPAETEAASLDGAAAATTRDLRVAFTSRVDLQRFVTVNGYSLGIEADFCDGESAAQPLVVSGLYWQGRLLVPGETPALRSAAGTRDNLLAYSFLLDREKASARPADICFVVAGGNEARGYRSNSVVIPRGEIRFALETLPPG